MGVKDLPLWSRSMAQFAFRVREYLHGQRVG
jgi:hypothetical protein